MPGPQDLVLPGHASDEYDVGVGEIEVAQSFHRWLKSIDENLTVFWAKPGSGFEPDSRWYIARLHSNPELCQYWVVENEDGSYTLPDERHLRRLQEMDTWTGRRTYDQFQLARSKRKAERQKRQDTARAEFREKLEERLRHHSNVQISVPSIPSAISRSGHGSRTEERVTRATKLILPPGVKT